MRLISLDRGQGKTTQLVDWLQIDPYHRAVLVATEMEADHVRRQLLRDYSIHTVDIDYVNHINQRMVYTPTQLDHLRGRRDLTLAIDNLEHVLASLFGDVPSVVTMGPISEYSTVTWEDD